MNHIHLIGRAAQDAVVRETTGGKLVANVNIVVEEIWRDAKGVRQSRKDWFRLVFWEVLAHRADDIRKDDEVDVEGKVQTRKWVDGKGVERYTTEVVVSRIN